MMKSSASPALTPVFLSSGDLLVDRRHAWALALAAEGDFAAAADLMVDVTAIAPDWAAGWLALAQAREKAGDVSGAVDALRHCAARDEADLLGARLHLTRLNASDSPPAMSHAYVAGLFDQYAAGFDAHLEGKLAYRGPQMLREAILAACKSENRVSHFANVIDLGCGTGLMARALVDLAGQIVGVDLSSRMIELARTTGLYTDLAVDDVVAFLKARKAASADLIVAADVLVYLGDLTAVIAACAKALSPGGLFAFTVQSQQGDGYRLGPDLRFHHGRSHIEGAASSAGLRVVSQAAVSTRDDEGQPVPGLVVVLGR
jgi:predicted TPR repeat methyltransferase